MSLKWHLQVAQILAVDSKEGMCLCRTWPRWGAGELVTGGVSEWRDSSRQSTGKETECLRFMCRDQKKEKIDIICAVHAVTSVASSSFLRPYELQLSRLLCP